MSGFMFNEMFGMLERLTALLATILVSRHGIPLTRIPHVALSRYCQQCAAGGIGKGGESGVEVW